MLAENFLTAEKLGIPEIIKGYLIQVLRDLELGRIKTASFRNDGLFAPKGVKAIAMNVIYDDEGLDECGTVGCIYGWVTHFAQKERKGKLVPGLFHVVHDYPALADLFMVGYNWNAGSASIGQAPAVAAAIRNYLTTGEAKWPEVIKEFKLEWTIPKPISLGGRG